MGAQSNIEWTDATFNPWIGCTKVSPACDNCYAESLMDKRLGRVEWGGERKRTSKAYWRQPYQWNNNRDINGKPFFVFCASLADVFDNQVPDEWRRDLFDMIRETTNLTWLLLTKRPQNIIKMLPEWWAEGPQNVWLGTTAEDQREAERRIPHLLGAPAAKRFLSCEPLLEWIDLTDLEDGDDSLNCLDGVGLEMNGNQPYQISTNKIDWVICGGESGPGARPMKPEWVEALLGQCEEAGVDFMFKQWGEFNSNGERVGKKKAGRLLEGRNHNGRPHA